VPPGVLVMKEKRAEISHSFEDLPTGVLPVPQFDPQAAGFLQCFGTLRADDCWGEVNLVEPKLSGPRLQPQISCLFLRTSDLGLDRVARNISRDAMN
jgi:hypothetical protein